MKAKELVENRARVRWTKKYVNRWIFSDNNWLCYQRPGGNNEPDYSRIEYDQEILLGMFRLMGAPIYGQVKGIGADENTVLVMMYYDDCSYWGYNNIEDLEIL